MHVTVGVENYLLCPSDMLDFELQHGRNGILNFLQFSYDFFLI